MILETDRLTLREMTQDDFGSLCAIVCDETVMYAYEHGFTQVEAQQWLDRQMGRYREFGFGLWAVILRECGEMIGQCGLTMQDWGEKQVLEVGYLFQREFWHQGYAVEAARACRDYAFRQLDATAVYSIIRENNEPSKAVARRNGMTVVGQLTKHYYGMEMPHLVFEAQRDAL